LSSIGILPLIIRAKAEQFISPKMINDILDTGVYGDIFTYYKQIFLLMISVVAVLLLVVKITFYRYEIKSSYINVPLLILAAFTLLAGASAEYVNVSLFGFYGRHEGTVTYLCYFALFFVAANTDLRENSVRNTYIALGILVTINFIIIMFDFYGKDLFHFQVFKSLIIPSDLYPGVEFQGSLNSTLHNPNYVSGLFGALTALFFSSALMDGRRWLSHAVLTAISFAVLIASLSTSGFISLVVVLPFIIIFGVLFAKRRQTLITAGAILVACYLIYIALYSHNPRVWEETVGFISNKADQKVEVVGPMLDPSDTSGQRTYIWRETAKLVKERPLLGHGHDVLAYYFPHSASRIGPGAIVCKPHNMYLDVAFGSGIIALGALMALFLLHFLNTTIIIFGKRNICSIAPLFVFWCAFLIQWMFNDSMITTTPVYWGLFGIAVSLNNSFLKEISSQIPSVKNVVGFLHIDKKKSKKGFIDI